MNKKTVLFGFVLLLMSLQFLVAQNPAPQNFTPEEQEVVNISKEKWQWMADKNAEPLDKLFHEKSMFVHMGGSWGKEQEINVIKSGRIWYKKADVHEVSVNIIGNTAILLNRITLLAVVGGNEVSNPFMVTEVYIKEGGKWIMGSLSFSRLGAPPAPPSGAPQQ